MYVEKIETNVPNVWNKDDDKSSEEAPCLNEEISKNHNERIPDEQDHKGGNSLPYRTTIND